MNTIEKIKSGTKLNAKVSNKSIKSKLELNLLSNINSKIHSIKVNNIFLTILSLFALINKYLINSILKTDVKTNKPFK